MPTLALIHGPCLGGGLELALACQGRLAFDTPGTQLGFPEVELGLLPGWGGTQRLPRVIGAENALKMILTGRRLSAAEAAKWGLVSALEKPPESGNVLDWQAPESLLTDPERFAPGSRLPSWRQFLIESSGLGRWLLFRGDRAHLAAPRAGRHAGPARGAARRPRRNDRGHGRRACVRAARRLGRLAMTPACRNLDHPVLPARGSPQAARGAARQ